MYTLKKYPRTGNYVVQAENKQFISINHKTGNASLVSTFEHAAFFKSRKACLEAINIFEEGAKVEEESYRYKPPIKVRLIGRVSQDINLPQTPEIGDAYLIDKDGTIMASTVFNGDGWLMFSTTPEYLYE